MMRIRCPYCKNSFYTVHLSDPVCTECDMRVWEAIGEIRKANRATAQEREETIHDSQNPSDRICCQSS